MSRAKFKRGVQYLDFFDLLIDLGLGFMVYRGHKLMSPKFVRNMKYVTILKGFGSPGFFKAEPR